MSNIGGIEITYNTFPNAQVLPAAYIIGVTGPTGATGPSGSSTFLSGASGNFYVKDNTATGATCISVDYSTVNATKKPYSNDIVNFNLATNVGVSFTDGNSANQYFYYVIGKGASGTVVSTYSGVTTGGSTRTIANAVANVSYSGYLLRQSGTGSFTGPTGPNNLKIFAACWYPPYGWTGAYAATASNYFTYVWPQMDLTKSDTSITGYTHLLSTNVQGKEPEDYALKNNVGTTADPERTIGVYSFIPEQYRVGYLSRWEASAIWFSGFTGATGANTVLGGNYDYVTFYDIGLGATATLRSPWLKRTMECLKTDFVQSMEYLKSRGFNFKYLYTDNEAHYYYLNSASQFSVYSWGAYIDGITNALYPYWRAQQSTTAGVTAIYAAPNNKFVFPCVTAGYSWVHPNGNTLDFYGDRGTSFVGELTREMQLYGDTREMGTVTGPDGTTYATTFRAVNIQNPDSYNTYLGNTGSQNTTYSIWQDTVSKLLDTYWHNAFFEPFAEIYSTDQYGAFQQPRMTSYDTWKGFYITGGYIRREIMQLTVPLAWGYKQINTRRSGNMQNVSCYGTNSYIDTVCGVSGFMIDEKWRNTSFLGMTTAGILASTGPTGTNAVNYAWLSFMLETAKLRCTARWENDRVGQYYYVGSTGTILPTTEPASISAWITHPYYKIGSAATINYCRFSLVDNNGVSNGNEIWPLEEFIRHAALHKVELFQFFNPFAYSSSDVTYETDPVRQYQSAAWLDSLLIEINNKSNGVVQKCMTPDYFNWQTPSMKTCAKLSDNTYLWRITSKASWTGATVTDSNGTQTYTAPTGGHGLWYGPVTNYDSGITFSFS